MTEDPKRDTTDIRLARAAEAARVRVIAEAAYRPYVATIGRPPAPMVADFEAAIEAKTLFVLDATGGTAAYIHLYPKGETLHIENLAVDPLAHRQGLARRLMAFAEAEARRLSLPCLDLYTNEAMHEAQALYRALGFNEVERREEAGFRRIYLRKAVSSQPST